MEGFGDHGLGEHGKNTSGGQGGDGGNEYVAHTCKRTAPKIDAMVDAATTIAQTPDTYSRDRPA